jgi:hypothetical protein
LRAGSRSFRRRERELRSAFRITRSRAEGVVHPMRSRVHRGRRCCRPPGSRDRARCGRFRESCPAERSRGGRDPSAGTRVSRQDIPRRRRAPANRSSAHGNSSGAVATGSGATANRSPATAICPPGRPTRAPPSPNRSDRLGTDAPRRLSLARSVRPGPGIRRSDVRKTRQGLMHASFALAEGRRLARTMRWSVRSCGQRCHLAPTLTALLRQRRSFRASLGRKVTLSSAE